MSFVAALRLVASSVVFLLWFFVGFWITALLFVWDCVLTLLKGTLAFLFSLGRRHCLVENEFDWKDVVTPDCLEFPDDFVWGTATSSHQVEGGCDNNNWFRWEMEDHDPPRIKTKAKCGDACDHWNRVEQDIQLMRNLEVDSYRFSIEWSKVEPQENKFDPSAIKHYKDQIDSLWAAGIQPMVTLHHFTQPLWFDDRGGWEQESNVSYFVRYARRMFQELGGKVTFWCTINEPEVFTFQGWLIGVFPPGKRLALRAAGEVMKNLLRAHVETYRAIKQEAATMSLKSPPQVGIVKDIFPFLPKTAWNVFDQTAAYLADDLFNDAILRFLSSGRFVFSVPFLTRVEWTDAGAPSCNDFIGLNYYSRYFLSIWHALTNKGPPEDSLLGAPKEVKMDMPYTMHAEGLYTCLVRLHKQLPGVPIYVTESGASDRNDSLRALFIHRHLYALSKAIKDGVPVQGFYYWSLMDNFEWCEGYSMRFGLYEVDFESAEKTRTLRDGSKHFVDVVKGFRQLKYRMADK